MDSDSFPQSQTQPYYYPAPPGLPLPPGLLPLPSPPLPLFFSFSNENGPVPFFPPPGLPHPPPSLIPFQGQRCSPSPQPTKADIPCKGIKMKKIVSLKVTYLKKFINSIYLYASTIVFMAIILIIGLYCYRIKYSSNNMEMNIESHVELWGSFGNISINKLGSPTSPKPFSFPSSTFHFSSLPHPYPTALNLLHSHPLQVHSHALSSLNISLQEIYSKHPSLLTRISNRTSTKVSHATPTSYLVHRLTLCPHNSECIGVCQLQSQAQIFFSCIHKALKTYYPTRLFCSPLFIPPFSTSNVFELHRHYPSRHPQRFPLHRLHFISNRKVYPFTTFLKSTHSMAFINDLKLTQVPRIDSATSPILAFSASFLRQISSTQAHSISGTSISHFFLPKPHTILSLPSLSLSVFSFSSSIRKNDRCPIALSNPYPNRCLLRQPCYRNFLCPLHSKALSMSRPKSPIKLVAASLPFVIIQDMHSMHSNLVLHALPHSILSPPSFPEYYFTKILGSSQNSLI